VHSLLWEDPLDPIAYTQARPAAGGRLRWLQVPRAVPGMLAIATPVKRNQSISVQATQFAWTLLERDSLRKVIGDAYGVRYRLSILFAVGGGNDPEQNDASVVDQNAIVVVVEEFNGGKKATFLPLSSPT